MLVAMRMAVFTLITCGAFVHANPPKQLPGELPREEDVLTDNAILEKTPPPAIERGIEKATARVRESRAWVEQSGPLKDAIAACDGKDQSFNPAPVTKPSDEAVEEMCDKMPDGSPSTLVNRPTIRTRCQYTKFTPCVIDFQKTLWRDAICSAGPDWSRDAKPFFEIITVAIHCELTAVLGVAPEWVCRAAQAPQAVPNFLIAYPVYYDWNERDKLFLKPIPGFTPPPCTTNLVRHEPSLDVMDGTEFLKQFLKSSGVVAP